MPPVTNPLVSVVIPTHNRADLLGGAIESVLRQEGADLDVPGAIEVIVVDDASTDRTVEVLDRYGHALIRLRNERPSERGASRNAGAAVAKGRWLAFLDSDDEWEDRKLAEQLGAMADTRGACLAACWLIDSHGAIVGMDHRRAHGRCREIDIVNPYCAAPSSLLIDRELFRTLGGFPEERVVQGSEDWLFMAKLIASSGELVELAQPLVRYRVHTGNSTARPDGYLNCGLAAVEWLERHGLSTPARARLARAQKYEVAARAYALHGQVALAWRYMRLAAALSGDPIGLIHRSGKAGFRAALQRLSPELLDPAGNV